MIDQLALYMQNLKGNRVVERFGLQDFFTYTHDVRTSLDFGQERLAIPTF